MLLQKQVVTLQYLKYLSNILDGSDLGTKNLFIFDLYSGANSLNKTMYFPIQLPPHFLQKAYTLNIFPQDIIEQFTRGSGSGGQKMNKTSSTVVLRHIPTGTEVRCQEFREQSKNRMAAYKLLILKIEDKIKGKESERAQKIFKLIKQKRKRSKRAQQKVLEAKKHHGEKKATRKKIRI